MTRTLALILITAVAAAPAIAQVPNPAPTRELPYDRGYDKHTPKHDAVDAEEAPVTQALNNAANAAAVHRETAGHARDEARYEADLAAYSAALAARQRRQDRDDAFYARQRAAYADAMEVWRWQVADCDHGIRRACEAPTPNPADFF